MPSIVANDTVTLLDLIWALTQKGQSVTIRRQDDARWYVELDGYYSISNQRELARALLMLLEFSAQQRGRFLDTPSKDSA